MKEGGKRGWWVLLGGKGRGGDVLHAAGTAPGVTVVEFETFALEDECAEAVLDKLIVSFGAFRECGLGREVVEGGVLEVECWRVRERVDYGGRWWRVEYGRERDVLWPSR